MNQRTTQFIANIINKIHDTIIQLFIIYLELGMMNLMKTNSLFEQFIKYEGFTNNK